MIPEIVLLTPGKSAERCTIFIFTVNLITGDCYLDLKTWGYSNIFKNNKIYVIISI